MFKYVLAGLLVLCMAACQSMPARQEAAQQPAQEEEEPEPRRTWTFPRRHAPFEADVELGWTGPVVFGVKIEEEHIHGEMLDEDSGDEELARVELIIKGIPDEEEGESFTIIGGGTHDTGLHGPNATGLEKTRGFHFAQTAFSTDDNPPRTEEYKKDYTRTVEEGRLEFILYYFPTNINSWGDRYFYGTELALTMMRKGTGHRVMHAHANQFNWAIGGVGPGNSARITIDIPEEPNEE